MSWSVSFAMTRFISAEFVINGADQSFDDECPVIFTLTRPTLKQPLYFGIRLVGQEPLAKTPDKGGVLVVAGWDPTTALTEAECPFVYVRGD